MDESGSKASAGQGTVTQERREYPYLRQIFEEAYLIALPFIDPKQGWGGQAMTRHAYPALQEAFPKLALQDLAILVPALERVFKERNRAASAA